MSLRRILSVCLLSVAALLGCSESDTPISSTTITEPTSPWLQIVGSHTSGQISRVAPIEVRFNQALPKDVSKLLTIRPAIEGQGELVNPRLYRFTPAASLPSGQKYSVSIEPEAIGLSSESLDAFTFDIQVIEQAFKLDLTGLVANKDNTMTLNGTLTTSDVAEPKDVANILSAAYLGQPVDVVWDEADIGHTFSFGIERIERQKEEGLLSVLWNGQSIGVTETGKRDFEVPPIGIFVVSSINAIQGDNQIIEVNFSEPLDKKQDIKGLVQLSKGRFSTKIDGSKLTLYPSTALSGEVTLTVDGGIQNAKGMTLGKSINRALTFLSKKPAVRFVGSGNILPVSDNLSIPFESVNVNSVQVTAFQVFDHNMGQFFQENEYAGTENLKRVGRYLWRKTVQLKSPVQDQWNRFQLDVKDLVTQYPGSLFRFELSLNRSNSILACSEDDKNVDVVKEAPFKNFEDIYVTETSAWDGIQNYYQVQNRSWKDRNNPCKDQYYSDQRSTKAAKNFIASDLGLIAKLGEDQQLLVVATKLSKGTVAADTHVEVRDFQNQVIAAGKTDNNGFLKLPLSSSPFLLVGTHNKDVGYLKINKAQALSTSHFDVGGSKSQNGVKGFVYGERGVWRPGDDIHITVVIEDKNDAVPDTHPLMLEFFNPKNQRVDVQVNANPLNGFYTYTLKTNPDDMTGEWSVVASLGSIRFNKSIMVETVKPNHLKMDISINDDVVKADRVGKRESRATLKGEFFSQWLHGAKASGLKADIVLKMREQTTRFGTYSDFLFDDPSRQYSGNNLNLDEFKLDAEGKASLSIPFKISSAAPGMLKGTLTSRVFEPSGDFSIAKQDIDIHPYEAYVGMSMPKGDAARGMLLTDETHKVELVSVDVDGKLNQGEQDLEVTLYKLQWKWWWDSSADNLASYVNRYSTKPLKKESVTLTDGIGHWEFEVKYPDWGRYMVRACDKNGYHCTGQVFYMDWPGWAGRGQQKKGLGANMLTLASDKPKYEAGETALITLPEATTGRALVTVETGSKVLQYRWVELAAQGTQLSIPITDEMAPNVYISVSVVQPHEQKKNDEPIRLMGVVPLLVSDPGTQLKPALTAPQEVQPESLMTVEVTEEQGKAMTYTLAVVDEGLLGLTQYRTPDLHKAFYKREALGIQTWDLFDDVVGAYGAQLEQLLAIGGDGSESAKDDDTDSRRFPPVVRFMGPFHLEAGAANKHQVDIPQYLGAVRVMVVAGEKGAYGRTQEEVLVRKSINVLATLPRVLGPDETLQMPVAVFSTVDQPLDVQLEVRASDQVTLLTDTLNVSFEKAGDKMVFVPMRAISTGVAKVTISARSGNETAQQTINIPISHQVARQHEFETAVIQPNEEGQIKLPLFGLENTREAVLEISNMPPLNLASHVGYLIGYPHGCVEQTTSKAFPQLFLPSLTKLTEQQLADAQNFVSAAIEKLSRYQTTQGGFSYWPGASSYHDWATSYAGHFLILAKDKGYDIPQEMLNAWLLHQKQAARSWTTGYDKEQAYRLFTLALIGAPEIGAMNRLRAREDLADLAKVLLAASYQLAGQLDAAQALGNQVTVKAKDYAVTDQTFGSNLRDRAIYLMSLLVLDDQERSAELAQSISDSVREGDNRYSTQSTAFALLAMARYGESFPQASGQVTVDLDGNTQQATLQALITSMNLDASGDGDMSITNELLVPLYVNVMTSAIPEKTEELAFANDLSLEVRYVDVQGNAINFSDVAQGKDVRVQVRVENRSAYKLDYLSLTVPVASGFEIRTTAQDAKNNPDIDYQDVRDDRVHTYFKLQQGESKTFEYDLNASYQGRFYQPPVIAEDMYDAKRRAGNVGQWIEIVR